MPKVNVYLPEDLYERVKNSKLPISAICQTALAEALDDIDGVQETTIVRRLSWPEDIALDIPIGRHVHEIVMLAYGIAGERGSPTVEAEDIMAAVVDQGDSLVVALLEQHGFAATDLRAEISALTRQVGPASDIISVRLSHDVREILEKSAEQARTAGAAALLGRHLFFVIAEEKGPMGQLIRRLGVDRALTSAAFDLSELGIAFGLNSATLASRSQFSGSMWDELRTRLTRIEEELSALRQGK